MLIWGCSCNSWAAAEGGGGKTYRVNLGGEKVPQSVLSKTTLGGHTEIGVGLVGGGERIVGGGSKNIFGEGFFARIYGMFSTPPSFPPPFAPLSDLNRGKRKRPKIYPQK